MKKGVRKIIKDTVLILLPLLLFPLKKIAIEISAIIINEKFSKEPAEKINDLLNNFKISWQWLIPFLMILIFIFIRKKNEKKFFNFGNEYMNYPYIYFFIAGKILGFKSISLQRIPIYLQAKLIINDTFKEIIFQKDLEINDSEPDYKLISNSSRTLTLVIEDTYLVKENQLSDELKKTDILRITKGDLTEGARDYSPKFIKQIDNQIFQLEKKYKRINMCATTNTKHTYKIISDNFKKGRRGDVDSLNIYQQNRNGKRIFETGVEIKL